MTPQQTQWGYLETGMYLQDARGERWLVTGKRRGSGGGWQLRIRNDLGWEAQPERGFDDPVTLLVPTAEEQMSVLRETLGAEVIERRVFRLEELREHPDNKWVRYAIASHLLHFHHISISTTAHVENDDIEGLLEMHALEHAKPQPDWLPHVHVPTDQL